MASFENFVREGPSQSRPIASVPMPSSSSQEASPPSIGNEQTVQPNPASQALTMQIHGRFAHFRDRYPHSSLTAVLESGPAVNAAGVAEYVVRATISLEGRPLVSSLAAAITIEEAEDRARLRNLALAEAVMTNSGGGMALATSSAAQASPPLTPRSTPPQTNLDYGSDDGLGDTLVNLGPLDSPEESTPASSSKTTSAKSGKPKPKPKTKKPPAIPTSDSPSIEAAPTNPATDEASADPVQEFVADWSEDLAQISVELKRLNWDNQQEQEYLQRTFNKSSRDDIIDHGELMDYLGYLQALPSHLEEPPEADGSSITDASLSVDEANLAPKSVSELMASAGLKSGAEIAAPSPAVAAMVTEAEMPETTAKDSTTPADNPTDGPIVREPEPEIEIANDEADSESDDELNTDPSAANSQAPTESLTRSEMMNQTARLCKELGWKNRQGSDFLKATYNKATRKDLTDAEMMDFLEQLRSLSTTEALPY